jgi:hypothetical protein
MSVLAPAARVHRIDQINLEALAAQGVRALLIDRDNTCIPRDTGVAPEAVLAWFDRARELGFSLCLVSNNFHTSHIEQSARELGVEKVDHAMKPAPFAVWHALNKLGVPREAAVLIGDQLLTDVLAGATSGVRTILVDPQSTKDLWYTQIFRLVEGRALKNVPYGNGTL